LNALSFAVIVLKGFACYLSDCSSLNRHNVDITYLEIRLDLSLTAIFKHDFGAHKALLSAIK
jgi:hypothetical protein